VLVIRCVERRRGKPNLSNTLGLPLLAYCNTVLQKGSFIQLYPFSVLEGSLAKRVANFVIQTCAPFDTVRFGSHRSLRTFDSMQYKMILMPLAVSLFI
jgi:hypothetical protein